MRTRATAAVTKMTAITITTPARQIKSHGPGPLEPRPCGQRGWRGRARWPLAEAAMNRPAERQGTPGIPPTRRAAALHSRRRRSNSLLQGDLVG